MQKQQKRRKQEGKVGVLGGTGAERKVRGDIREREREREMGGTGLLVIC